MLTKICVLTTILEDSEQVETPDNPFIAPVNIKIIESIMNRVSYQGVVDKYPRFTKLIIVDLMKKFPSISLILEEDYQSIKDDIPLEEKKYEKKDDEMGILEIRTENMQTPIPTPPRSPRIILSSDKNINQELTASRIYDQEHGKKMCDNRQIMESSSKIVVVKLEGASADAMRALKNFMLCRQIRDTHLIQLEDVMSVLWLHFFMPSHRSNEFELFSSGHAVVNISPVDTLSHEIQLNHSLFHLFSDEMMSDVDVFRPGVLDVVAAESYGTLVVTIQRDVIV
ncbi:hypothetical protein Tco_0405542 [Tanacetum coccineum]